MDVASQSLAGGGVGLRTSDSAIAAKDVMAIVDHAAARIAFVIRLAGAEAPSAESSEVVNRVACVELIKEVDALGQAGKWGALKERLMALLNASYDPDEALSPMNAASLVTLDELLRTSQEFARPAIGLNRAGNLWLEWVLPEHERFGLECLPGAQLFSSWIQRDSGRVGAYATQYGTLSVAHFASKDFRGSRIWKLLEQTR
jgi:hypothetical protein